MLSDYNVIKLEIEEVPIVKMNRSEIENNQTMERIKAKSCLFININKTNKPWQKWTRNKRKNTNYLSIRNEIGYITIDSTDVKGKGISSTTLHQ